ncbi:uncharacterized protein STEHIDRAFT_160211 [Stereum hirsutum FP-91666 SS1]|uniref:uncharacterized protein n=1 Tax=Stereum hirsutum (strain FP-91666) TaxID=721885 RepID=UPI000444A1A4|nr:uncharacterized protein STEHIDRAFT_160211 [Stereum hirsutum FP-91666 SS1]EIM83636.1 hypothetical protein STEHIDRAFT_160211 [Stereum hirsutum FP-91666 SS1]
MAKRRVVKSSNGSRYELRHAADCWYFRSQAPCPRHHVSGSKDFTSVFKNVDRWEALIVDEGQQLKNDGSLLFKKLNELNTIHRIIMTGTPLNNNMHQWNDLTALEEYDQENLNEESVKALHERLRPYFLRRVKAEVLKLPPKNEVIVPLSLTPLQKGLYKSVLSKNAIISSHDGNTKQPDRQKGMDEFNRPNSDVFIYLLSTRAGGVGINLWSADTDLQAIARSHRYGQTKPCLVFKLMAKDIAEERIVQNGKKKLILDHVIVQKMDDKETGEDVSSILTHGAEALFEEGEGAKDITCTPTRIICIDYENDVDNLITTTESEITQEEQVSSAMTFSFAKV